MTSHVALVALGFAAACASAGSGTPDGGGGSADAPVATPDAPIGFPDAAPMADAAPVADAAPAPDSAPGTPDAAPVTPDAGSITTTLSQTTLDTIVAENSVACVTRDALGFPESNAINRYFRVFDLAALGITGPFSITQVTFGVETADGASGSQPATVLVYTVAGTGAPTLAALTQIASTPITIVDQTRQLLNVGINATVPAGARFAIELSIPDGDAGPDLFFFGSNAGAESAPAYMVAPDCGVNDMTAADPLNTSNTMRLVMKVTGSYFP